MTDVEKREKVIRGLECCLKFVDQGGCPEECPYRSDGRCYETIKRDALALLKEQEPRVLTPREFDEVRLSKPVWLEVRNMDLLEPALFRYQRSEYGKVAFSLIENRAIERDVTEYYWGWRCWSAEPGDEVRKETKWDEA